MKNYFRTAIVKNHLKTPVFLILFITDRCNSRCKHCFNWSTLNSSKNELSLSEIESIAKQIPTLETLAISGGEPFLREDIGKIYRLFNKHCKRLSSFSIPTNGFLPEVILEKAKDILVLSEGKGIISINLSLDGLEETHDYIRGLKGSFNNIFKTYNLINSLKEDFKNVAIRVNTTITNINVDELPELISLVKEKMPGIESHNFEFMRGKPKDPKIKCPSVEKLRTVKKHIVKTFDYYNYFQRSKFKSKLVNGLRSYQYDLYLDIFKKKKQLIPCYAGLIHCVIDAQANVYFCELLPSIGSLRDARTFLEVWHSPKAALQRKSIRNRECYCTHSCFQNGNIQYNPFLYPQVLINSFKYKPGGC